MFTVVIKWLGVYMVTGAWRLHRSGCPHAEELTASPAGSKNQTGAYKNDKEQGGGSFWDHIPKDQPQTPRGAACQSPRDAGQSPNF